ncbi:MAG TPA: DUF4383 domain-containing protein [Aeromicrobium sp.]|nr:DUF4383 domain-containing protein [Aeromicrobium sp.]
MQDAKALRLTVLALCVVVYVHDAVALAINPDFGIGAAAHTVKFLGVDYNGWHAVAGFALFGPGLFVWRRTDLSRIFALAVVFSLLVTAAWGLLQENPLVVLSLPDQRADAIFHITVAAVFLIPVLADAIGSMLNARRGEPALVS